MRYPDRHGVDHQDAIRPFGQPDVIGVAVAPGIEVEVGRDLAGQPQANGTSEARHRLAHPGERLFAMR
ncbi:MAG TPA: hypothetical protein PK095_24610, partial [Myxococcota bacterium]|nr:hypothetical protein [Myxococcota bacterium]